ncbi:MAG: hypothetical protein ACD_22C00027G0001 [uncultured bacterium]|nr:MAG: hypothetical protein ACD_22C00027G0001 [uncultured bacterium]
MATPYNYIDKNKRETFVVVAIFILVVTFLGWFIGEYFFEGSGTAFVGLALIFSGISSFISYYFCDKIVLGISGAVEVTYPGAPELHNLVDNMCIASGLPKPKIYLIEDTAMNAFATGRDPKHATLCFTTGIVNKLEKRELEGVIAHEMSHIQNYDIRLMTLVSVLVGSILLLSDWFTRGFFLRGRGRKSSSGSGIVFLIGIILLLLSPIFAKLLQLALSRSREYMADASAALMTRYPKGLADALQKLSMDTGILEVANRATASLYIVDPIRHDVINQGFKSGPSLYDTHPPIQERIKRLTEM